jgi:probable rRNA maturation factor
MGFSSSAIPRGEAPRTMILLDPDLDPDPSLASATRPVLPVRRGEPRTHRLPSARTLAQFLRGAQAAVGLRGKVSVLLTTDKAIRKLNRQFRGINKATDVLSFPAAEAPGMGIAGDLAVSVPTALRQASEQGHSLGVEIKILILHGLLHLAGYDHEIDSGRMARRERVLRARLGLPQGLIERNEGDELQLVHKRVRNGAALAAERKAGVPIGVPSGANARARNEALAARPKSCPDTEPEALASCIAQAGLNPSRSRRP